MHITQAQIAKLCGTSQQTVSSILRRNRAHLYSEKIRKKVLKVANELGYFPNPAAVAVSNGMRGTVMMICPPIEYLSTLDWGYVIGIQKTLLNKGEHLFFRTIDDFFKDNMQFDKEINHNCDAVIIAYFPSFKTEESYTTKLKAISVPHVFFNEKRKFDSVYPDDFGGAKMITEFLIKKGHKKIGYLNYAGVPFEYFKNKDMHYSTKDRYEGYCSAMREAGLIPLLIHSDRKPHGLYNLGITLDNIFRSGNFPSAFVCYCNQTPDIIMHKALKNGLNEDYISIATFTSPFANESFVLGRKHPNIQIPVIEVGELSGKMLIEKIKNANEKIISISVPYKVIKE